jgi:FlaG/FlaF family flagellin (archaellin)
VFICLPTRLLLLHAVVLSGLSAQPARVVAGSLEDLQKCVNQPAGTPLVCALSGSSSPYAISGAPLTIRRSDTTVEGIAAPGQDPPTLKRTDPDLKKMIVVPRGTANVTIRNLQIDGNKSIAKKDYFDINIEGSYVTVANNYFGDSSYYCVFIGGPHLSIHDNTFGKLMVGGALRSAPGIDTAIKAWGPNATQFSIESNKISDYRGAMSITDAPGGSDPAQASVIAANTLYHDSVCVPNCGGGQIYVAGKTSNVKITKNTIDGGWAESEDRETVHSYGIEIDSKVSYIYSGSNQIFNNSISGIWIGNGANHITVENDTVYDNGLNGVQISGNGKLAPVSMVSIIGLTSNRNDRHRSPRAPYPSLPRFWGVMIQNGNADASVCIQSDSKLGSNAKGPIYSDSPSGYAKAESCPRPYN